MDKIAPTRWLETVWDAGRSPVFVSRRFQEDVVGRTHDPLAASWDVTDLNLRDPEGAVTPQFPPPGLESAGARSPRAS